MYLVYQPKGQSEPKRFKWSPRSDVMALEREGLERRTSRNFSQFTADVVEGNSLCRRALLHMFLRREHTGLKFEDVDFAWEEVRLEYSKQEYEAMREGLVQRLNGDDLAAALDHLDKQIAEAFDEQDVDGSGKASLPIVD